MALARKADLRPSPLAVSLSRDWLCIHAQFHINYLPDMLATFRGLVSGRPSLDLAEFDLQGPVLAGARLDSSLAHADPATVLDDAAHLLAFRANRLYIPVHGGAETVVSSALLARFHRQTLDRPRGHGLVLSVNDAAALSPEQFMQQAQQAAFPVATTWDKEAPGADCAYFGGETRIDHHASDGNCVLVALPVQGGGYATSDYSAVLVLEALLRRLTRHPTLTVYASVTAHTALLGLRFAFPPQTADRATMTAILKDSLARLLALVPADITEADLAAAKTRAVYDYAASIDSRTGRLLTFAHQHAATGVVRSTAQLAEQIAALSRDRVCDMLATTLAAKPTVVARGNLKQIPHMDELV